MQVKRRYPILWRHCDVNTARKIVNIFFLTLHIFLQLKIDKKHFYQKVHTGAQISTQGPTLDHNSSPWATGSGELKTKQMMNVR